MTTIDPIAIRGIASKLAVAAHNPVSHGGIHGLIRFVLARADDLFDLVKDVPHGASLVLDFDRPGSWDEKALEVARRYTSDEDALTRAQLQCAVLDAMRWAHPSHNSEDQPFLDHCATKLEKHGYKVLGRTLRSLGSEP